MKKAVFTDNFVKGQITLTKLAKMTYYTIKSRFLAKIHLKMMKNN